MSEKPTGDDESAGEDTSAIEKDTLTLDTGQDDRNVSEEQPDDLHTPLSGNTRVITLIDIFSDVILPNIGSDSGISLLEISEATAMLQDLVTMDVLQPDRGQILKYKYMSECEF